jgi:hypothetical protein
MPIQMSSESLTLDMPNAWLTRDKPLRGLLGSDGRADDPGLHGPVAGVSATRLATGRDPTSAGIGRSARPEESVRGRAEQRAAAPDRALTGWAIHLEAFRPGAVGGTGRRDLLHPTRARRPLRPGRTCRSLRSLRDLPGREIDRAERPVLHLGRVDGVGLQLSRADAVTRQRGGDCVGASAERDRERETRYDQCG